MDAFSRCNLVIIYNFPCVGGEATLESLIAMLEAIGCFEGAEICREQGMYMLSMRSICLQQLTVHNIEYNVAQVLNNNNLLG